MNSFDYDDDGMETSKANGTAPDTRLRTMAKAFRTIDLCIALFFLLWVTMLRLPLAVRILAELLRRLLLLVTPLTVSLLFAVSVSAVMVRSYRLSSSSRNIAEDRNVGNNYSYEDMVNVNGEIHSTTSFHRSHEEAVEVLPYEVEEDEAKVVYEDKEKAVTSCVSDKSKTPFAGSDMRKELDVLVEGIENQSAVVRDGGGSGGDVVLENEDSSSSQRDVVSDADFKKIIDAFIKKQRDFLKLENRCDIYGEAHAHVYCY